MTEDTGGGFLSYLCALEAVWRNFDYLTKEEVLRYCCGGLFSLYGIGEGLEAHTMTVPVLQGSFSFGGPPMQQLRRIDIGI